MVSGISSSLELDDTKAHRAIADLKAKQIERDIANDLFDSTLEKYRAAYQKGSQKGSVTIFLKYRKQKAKSLRARSIQKYDYTLNQLREFCADVPMSAEKAEAFKEWLSRQMEPITLKQRISLLKSAWEWAIANKLATENPWAEVLKQVKVAPKQRPKPFTKDERQRIIATFRQNRYYAY